jgi:hypothetical protein
MIIFYLVWKDKIFLDRIVWQVGTAMYENHSQGKIIATNSLR